VQTYVQCSFCNQQITVWLHRTNVIDKDKSDNDKVTKIHLEVLFIYYCSKDRANYLIFMKLKYLNLLFYY